ncbi:hypothetical protein [Photobacterium profundum]|uniref:Uncharacterized protein n=1 Tax=Photobacterium profundum (strain SS9) TaxID=298386 RepID=Q6LJT3_PHOPR|nr:hypothetical protein [Photobacterium profundum]CAG22447.1 hypothetical protein PBPRB0574 [Photobacterium profundum SS9]
MGYLLSQPSMSAGELSPEMYGRVDTDHYRIGLAKAENFFVNYHGGISNRPGTTLSYITARNEVVALIPFQFSAFDSFMLEFGTEYMRVMSKGKYITDNSGVKIQVVTPYLAGEILDLSYTQSADVLTIFHRNHAIQQIKRYSNIDWRVEPLINKLGPFESININESQFMYADKNGDVGEQITLISNFDAFTSDLVGKMVYLDQEETGDISQWMQRYEVAEGDQTYNAGNYYICTKAELYNGKKAQTGDIAPVHSTGERWDGPGKFLPDDNRDANIGVRWAYLNSGYGVVKIISVTDARHAICEVLVRLPDSVVGGERSKLTWNFPGETTQRTFSLATPPLTSNTMKDFTVKLVGTTTKTLQFPNEYSIDFDAKRLDLYVNPGVTSGSGSSSTTTARDVDVVQQATSRSTYKWAIEIWRNSTGYPRCGTYFQQRLSMANTISHPQTVWLSRTDSFNDFSKTRPILADDSMRYDINSLQVNEIFNIVPLNSLLLFTSGGLWSLAQDQQGAFSAESPPSVKMQNYEGANKLRPIVAGSTAIYVQQGDRIVRDIQFSWSSDSFEGVDLTVRASHLFKHKRVVEWAYAKNPDKLIWVIFDDGTAATLTYMKEQQIWGWCPHTTNGKYKNVASVEEGSRSSIYFVVERIINGAPVNVIEYQASREFKNIEDAHFVDCGVSIDNKAKTWIELSGGGNWLAQSDVTMLTGADFFNTTQVGNEILILQNELRVTILILEVTDAKNAKGRLKGVVTEGLRNTKITSWGLAVHDVSGLDHLNDQEVAILVDGGEAKPQVVSGGKISLQYPGLNIHAGLSYKSIGRTLPIEVLGAGGGQTVKPKQKIVNKLYLEIHESVGVLGGTKLDDMDQLKQREWESYGMPASPVTGIVEIDVSAGYENPGQVYFSQEAPLPLSVLSIIPEVTISDTD